MKKEIEKLLESKLSAAEISRETGIAASTIQMLRLGKRRIGGMSLDNAEKLSEYYQKYVKEE